MSERRMLSRHELPLGVLYSLSSFSPDGRYLAICCKHHVIVLDVEDGTQRDVLNCKGIVKDVEFSPDGKMLACASMSDGRVHLIDTKDFVESRKPIHAESQACQTLTFSPDGRVLAVGGFDKRLRLFDVTSGTQTSEFGECPSYIVKIAFSPNGRRIASASADGQVCVWNTRTGDRLLEFDFPSIGYAKPEFSADGQSLLISSHHETKVLRATDRDSISKLSVMELNEIACQLTIEH